MLEKTHKQLDYLHNKPKRINWKVIAGMRKLSHYEAYDLIYDEYDLRIRKMDTSDNLTIMRRRNK